jgi:hypothetical protein
MILDERAAIYVLSVFVVREWKSRKADAIGTKPLQHSIPLRMEIPKPASDDLQEL